MVGQKTIKNNVIFLKKKKQIVYQFQEHIMF